jgi:hypothetical protein
VAETDRAILEHYRRQAEEHDLSPSSTMADQVTRDLEVDAIQHMDERPVTTSIGLRQIASFDDHHSCRIASTGYSRAACMAGWIVATAAIARLASTIQATSSGSSATGR